LPGCHGDQTAGLPGRGRLRQQLGRLPHSDSGGRAASPGVRSSPTPAAGGDLVPDRCAEGSRSLHLAEAGAGTQRGRAGFRAQPAFCRWAGGGADPPRPRKGLRGRTGRRHPRAGPARPGEKNLGARGRDREEHPADGERCTSTRPTPRAGGAWPAATSPAPPAGTPPCYPDRRRPSAGGWPRSRPGRGQHRPRDRSPVPQTGGRPAKRGSKRSSRIWKPKGAGGGRFETVTNGFSTQNKTLRVRAILADGKGRPAPFRWWSGHTRRRGIRHACSGTVFDHTPDFVQPQRTRTRRRHASEAGPPHGRRGGSEQAPRPALHPEPVARSPHPSGISSRPSLIPPPTSRAAAPGSNLHAGPIQNQCQGTALIQSAGHQLQILLPRSWAYGPLGGQQQGGKSP